MLAGLRRKAPEVEIVEHDIGLWADDRGRPVHVCD